MEILENVYRNCVTLFTNCKEKLRNLKFVGENRCETKLENNTTKLIILAGITSARYK